MTTYKHIPSRRWVNTVTGQIASLYGAVPWHSDAERANWRLETRGWTVERNENGRITIGCAAGTQPTESAAIELVARLNA